MDRIFRYELVVKDCDEKLNPEMPKGVLASQEILYHKADQMSSEQLQMILFQEKQLFTSEVVEVIVTEITNLVEDENKS